MQIRRFCLLLGLVLAAGCFSLAAATFTSSGGVTFNNGLSGATPASPYPSTINVSGLSGTINSLTVTVTGLTHPRGDDIDILLVGPNGGKLILMSDVGGVNALNVTLTIDDNAASLMADAGPISSGSYKPSNVDGVAEVFTNPAPAGPYSLPAPAGSATLSSVFSGTTPNGLWSLYVIDDSAGPSGQVASFTSWSLNIATASETAVTTTSVTSSRGSQCFTGDSVTFTATVTSSSTVSLGTVTFKDNGTSVSAAIPVSAGQAAFTNSTLPQGTHVITAEYSGATGFGPSSGTTTLAVDNHTTTSAGNTFANTGAINLPDSSSLTLASVYPSRIFVTGLSGTVSKVTVLFNNLTHPRPDDLDLLLVGPHGEKFVVLSDVGGTAPASALNLAIDDTASSLAPDSTALTSSSFKPTDIEGSDTFPAPAPAGAYDRPAPAGTATLSNTFAGIDPNGTWSLYVIDAGPGPSGQVASLGAGWALSFTTSSDAATTTTLTSSSPDNHSFTGDNVTLTAMVTKTTNNAAVTAGTVTFRDGAIALSGPIALDSSGKATFSTASLSEGTHSIDASYSGSPGACNLSSANLIQSVDTRTVVTGNTYANPGTITLPDLPGLAPASVYPSRIFVTNSGIISNLTLQLKGLSHPRLNNLDILLVSPSGGKLVVISDVGGSSGGSALNLTLTDAATTALPEGAFASGSYRPTAISSDSDLWPAPAPSAPAFAAPSGTSTFASVFNGQNIAGTWSLYVVDDTAGPTGSGNGTLSGGWSLSFTAPMVLATPTNIITSNQLGQCGAQVSFGTTASGLPTPTLSYQIGTNLITSPYFFPGGVTTVTCIARNGAEPDKTATFTVTVRDTQAPAISATNLSLVIPATAASTNVVYSFTASDNCGVVSNFCTPPPGSVFLPGTNTVTLAAYDAAGNSTTCAFTVAVDRLPSPGPDFLGTTTNCPLTIPIAKLMANDSDPDGDPLTLTVSNSITSQGGTINPSGTNLNYLPAPAFTGQDSFTYRLSDGRGGMAQGTVSVSVVNPNNPSFNRVSVLLSTNHANLSLLGIPTWRYTVQIAPAITGPWTNVQPEVVAGADGMVRYTEASLPSTAARFYRFLSTP